MDVKAEEFWVTGSDGVYWLHSNVRPEGFLSFDSESEAKDYAWWLLTFVHPGAIFRSKKFRKP